MVRTRWVVGVVAGLGLLALVGCKHHPAGHPGGASAPSPGAGQSAGGPVPSIDPVENRLGPNARVGTVVGRVLLAPGTALPRWTLDEIGRGAESPPIPPECGPPRDTDTLPVTGVGSPTRLSGILVSATGDREAFFGALGTWEHADRQVRIDQCRVAPKLISATEGDTLVITNNSPVVFLPTVGPTTFFETLTRGQSRRVALDRGGVTWVRCGFANACGRGDLVVILHPVHTVSDAEGRFEMHNVPADQDVVIHAWHPLFREANLTTRVPRNGRVEVELVVTPVTRELLPNVEPFHGPYAAGPSSDVPGGFPHPPDAGRPRPRPQRAPRR